MQALVIARVIKGTPMEQVAPLITPEAKAVWDLYATDKLRTIHYIADMSGVVMLWEISSLEELETALKTLPMVKEGVLAYEIIVMKPYTGIEEFFTSKYT